jgi:hypothetical protein
MNGKEYYNEISTHFTDVPFWVLQSKNCFLLFLLK